MKFMKTKWQFDFLHILQINDSNRNCTSTMNLTIQLNNKQTVNNNFINAKKL